MSTKSLLILLPLTLLLACGGGGGDGTDEGDTADNGDAISRQPVLPIPLEIPIGGLGGTVDSSLIRRGDAADIVNHSGGINKVYLYNGTVTADDIGSGTEPAQTANVVQSACSWRYVFDAVDAGNYTIAFTNEADNDDISQNDNISFTGTQQITILDSERNEEHFNVAVVQVGPGKTYATVSAAADAIGDNTVVEIDAGNYVDDISVWRQDNIVLRGVGGYAHLRADTQIGFTSGNDQANGKGIWVTRGNNIRIENIEFSQASVADQNGAGIRAEGNNLHICNSYFHDNENGILGEAYGTMIIEYSEFNNNGFGGGFTHNLYIDGGEIFVFRYNYSHHARIGHNLKTRSQNNYIYHNRIMDEATGTASYAIDIPEGGLSYVIGNLLQQGPNTDNSAMLTYGVEGYSNDGRQHDLYVVNNTFVNDYGAGSFFSIAGGANSTTIVNNILAGGGNTPSGPNVNNNLITTDPGVVDINNYDYQLTNNSSAIGAGTDPGSGNGLSLTPVYEYVHAQQYRVRPDDGSIDVGAYEYDTN